MFSFRRDKVGFFITIILLTIVTGTLISTLVLLIVGMAQGDWKEYLLSVKWVLSLGGVYHHSAGAAKDFQVATRSGTGSADDGRRGDTR